MKAYEQLAVIDDELTEAQAKRAFNAWCKAVGYTEEQGNKELFKVPERVGITILRTWEKES